MKLATAGSLLAGLAVLAACATHGSAIPSVSEGGLVRRDAASGALVWTQDDSVKILPGDKPLKKNVAVTAAGAKGESVSFQIVVTAGKSAVNGVNVVPGDLSDGKGHTLAANSTIELYREFYLDLTHASGQFGHTGWWPDGLVPIGKDPYFHEQRNGAPFDVASGKNQAVWGDVNVPANAVPGIYKGEISVTSGKTTLAKVPVTFTVWNFAIPATSSLTSAFGFDSWGTYMEHYGNHWSTPLIVQLTNLYQAEAVKHRMSLYGNVENPTYVWKNNRVTDVSYQLFDETMVPALSGTLLKNGAQATNAQMPGSQIATPGPTAGPNDAQNAAYWKVVGAYFKAKGWLPRTFFYDFDEPQTASDFATVAHVADVVHQGDPAIPVMDTTTLHSDLIGKVNIWNPIVQELDSPGFPPPSAYAARQKAGDKVWFYTSNNSLDSGGPWPSFFVDAKMNDARIFTWLAWRYKLDGFLYYAVTLAYGRTPDPWTNVYNFGDNGDGTLFYPGKPSLIGGKHNIPCDSIRLKEIRAAMQDYEYMAILHAKGQDAFVDALVRKIATKTNVYSEKGEDLLAARAAMAQKILGQ